MFAKRNNCLDNCLCRRCSTPWTRLCSCAKQGPLWVCSKADANLWWVVRFPNSRFRCLGKANLICFSSPWRPFLRLDCLRRVRWKRKTELSPRWHTWTPSPWTMFQLHPAQDQDQGRGRRRPMFPWWVQFFALLPFPPLFGDSREFPMG